ncbi:hypothetical protein GFJ94_08740 [Flavobacterium sp. LMO8]|uniref:hypothetical protein n=1 Tax=Flavobacterium sp. LMO8 TaxID=2654244 RepID=UPI001290ECFD|nr:hypothetical protein [Flavobacterium sp. LMO8]MQP25150.1 hypothetical protein [Flavobacterium sp. LMO8]
MKKILLYSLFLGLLSFSTLNLERSENKTTRTNVVSCKHGQCKAIAKSTKKQCKNCVSKRGDSYCSRHK